MPAHLAVALDTSAAEGAVALLRELNGMTPAAVARGWSALVGSRAYRAWASAYGGHVDETLAWLRCHPPWSGETHAQEDAPGPARGVVRAFAQELGDLDRLAARCEQARGLPVAAAARAAAAALPAGTALSTTVFVLLSGDRQGMVNADGEVSMDLLAVPTVPAERWHLANLAHELHHVGSSWCRQYDPSAARVLSAGGSAAKVVRILDLLLSEGVANAYFTPLDIAWLRTLGPVLADVGVDETLLVDFERKAAAAQTHLPERIGELGGVLESLLSGAPDSAALAYADGMTDFRDDLPRPMAHFLGEVMVRAIRERQGDAAVLAALAELGRFVPAYQDAAAAGGVPALRPDLVAKTASLWMR